MCVGGGGGEGGREDRVGIMFWSYIFSMFFSSFYFQLKSSFMCSVLVPKSKVRSTERLEAHQRRPQFTKS